MQFKPSGFNQALPFVGYGLDLWNSIYTNSIQREFQEDMLEKQNEMNRQNMALQNQYNVHNAINAGLYERMSKEKAGLNVNSDGGFSPIAGVSAPGVSAPGVPGMNTPKFDSQMFSEFMKLETSKPLIDAQARDLNATAGLKELELKRQNEVSNVISSLSPEVVVDIEQGDGKTVKHYINITSPQALQAYRDIKKLKSDLASYDSDEAIAILNKKIAEGQYKDDSVIQAFVQEPVYKQKNFLADIAKAMSEVGLNAQKVLESQQNIRLMMSQQQLNELDAKIKAHDNTYLLLENIFGKDHEGILSAVTLTLGLLKDVANLGSAGAKVAGALSK